MIRPGILLALIVSLSACGVGERIRPGAYGKPLRSEKLTFDDIYFRAKARHTSEDRRDFAVSVRGADRNVAAALEAGEFAAVKYCIGLFGGSNIDWTAGPDQDPETIALASNGELVMTGRCTIR